MLLFTASWCNPCKDLKKWLDSKGIELDIVDIDKEPELAQQKGVRGIPCLFADNQLFVGREKIKPYLESKNV